MSAIPLKQDDKLEGFERRLKRIEQKLNANRLLLDRVAEQVLGKGEEQAVDLLGTPVIPGDTQSQSYARTVAAGWVNYLNEQAVRSFSINSRVTIAAVKARLAEGHSREDLHLVVWYCCRKWRGEPKTAEWLTPSTLLRPQKFQERLDLAKQAHAKATGGGK